MLFKINSHRSNHNMHRNSIVLFKLISIHRFYVIQLINGGTFKYVIRDLI